LQIGLGQLHRAALIVTGADVHDALGAEIHAGGLSRCADIVHHYSAHATRVVHAGGLSIDDRAGADVIQQNQAIGTRSHQTTYQEIMVAWSALERDIWVVQFGVWRAGNIWNRDPKQTPGGS
jgi:hypothetical protein